MDSKRLDLLANDVWHYVFAMLDLEIDVSTELSGEVATVCEKAFRIKLAPILVDSQRTTDGGS